MELASIEYSLEGEAMELVMLSANRLGTEFSTLGLKHLNMLMTSIYSYIFTVIGLFALVEGIYA